VVTPQVRSFLGPKSRSGVIAAGVMGAVLLIAIAWAAILWTRPEPIRIAFASSPVRPPRLGRKVWSRRSLQSTR
jgi:hypothetical protein